MCKWRCSHNEDGRQQWWDDQMKYTHAYKHMNTHTDELTEWKQQQQHEVTVGCWSYWTEQQKSQSQSMYVCVCVCVNHFQKVFNLKLNCANWKKKQLGTRAHKRQTNWRAQWATSFVLVDAVVVLVVALMLLLWEQKYFNAIRVEASSSHQIQSERARKRTQRTDKIK